MQSLVQSDATDVSIGNGPEAGSEITTLNIKLVEAIEKQASLEDALAHTRADLDIANIKIQGLESIQNEHRAQREKGILIDRKDVEIENESLLKRLTDESRGKLRAEKDKRAIELELESLTASLFDEANKMVATARIGQDMAEKRAEQILARCRDSEILMSSQQDQLAELKSRIQQMSPGAKDTAKPILPISTIHPQASRESLAKMLDFSKVNLTSEEQQQGTPTAQYFSDTLPSHTLQPIFRFDTPAYIDFVSFIRTSRPILIPQAINTDGIRSAAAASPQIPSTSTLQNFSPVMSAGSFMASGPNQSTTSSHSPSTTSMSQFQTSPNNQQSPISPLKDWRFVKRTIMEDLEPALRLDLAPGLSWLARRGVMNAILESTFIIDPLAAASSQLRTACALCGDARPEDQYLRRHRFRISNNSTAQSYSLCAYCVERTRRACDYVAFLRSIRDGVWKIDSESAEERAWEESASLRDKMFWARVGVHAWGLPSGPIMAVEGANREDTRTSAIDPVDVTQAPILRTEDEPTEPDDTAQRDSADESAEETFLDAVTDRKSISISDGIDRVSPLVITKAVTGDSSVKSTHI